MKKVNISVMKINNKAFDSASGYLRYIAKRPGVEKMSLLSDNRHQTKNQKEIIRQICLLDESIKDYPQYRAYVLNPCRFNAGSLISSYIRNNPSSKDNPKLNCYSDFSLAPSRLQSD